MVKACVGSRPTRLLHVADGVDAGQLLAPHKHVHLRMGCGHGAHAMWAVVTLGCSKQVSAHQRPHWNHQVLFHVAALRAAPPRPHRAPVHTGHCQTRSHRLRSWVGTKEPDPSSPKHQIVVGCVLTPAMLCLPLAQIPASAPFRPLPSSHPSSLHCNLGAPRLPSPPRMAMRLPASASKSTASLRGGWQWRCCRQLWCRQWRSLLGSATYTPRHTKAHHARALQLPNHSQTGRSSTDHPHTWCAHTWSGAPRP